MRIEYSVGEKKYYLEVDIRTIKEKEGIGVHMDNTAMLELCYDYDINVLTDLSEKLKEIYKMESEKVGNKIEFIQKPEDMAMEIAVHMDFLIIGHSKDILDNISEIKKLKKSFVNRATVADIGANFKLDNNSKFTHIIYKTMKSHETYLSSSIARLDSSKKALNYYLGKEDKGKKVNFQKLRPIGVKYKMKFGNPKIEDAKANNKGFTR